MSTTISKPDWLTAIEAQFGVGILKTAREIRPIEYRSTGSLALDVALGGGWPKRRVIDVVGKEGSGKTLLFMLAAVAAQREENLRSIVFDFEGTFEVELFKALGGDPGMLDIIRAENVEDRGAPLLFGEYAVDMAKIILRASDTHACMLFDSTGAMISVAEYDTKMEQGQEKQTMTQTARLMSDSLRVLVGSGMLARSANGMSMFFISQLRDNVGARAFRGIPPPDKKTGGRALRFYASTQAEVSRGDLFKGDVSNDFGRAEKGVEVGHETRIRVRKNKCNRIQGRVATFNLFSEGDVRGLDRVGELAQLAVLTGVVTKAASWFTYDGERFHGEDKFRDALGANSNMFAAVYAQTREALARMMDINAQPADEMVDETLFEGGEEIDSTTDATNIHETTE